MSLTQPFASSKGKEVILMDKFPITRKNNANTNNYNYTSLLTAISTQPNNINSTYQTQFEPKSIHITQTHFPIFKQINTEFSRVSQDLVHSDRLGDIRSSLDPFRGL